MANLYLAIGSTCWGWKICEKFLNYNTKYSAILVIFLLIICPISKKKNTNWLSNLFSHDRSYLELISFSFFEVKLQKSFCFFKLAKRILLLFYHVSIETLCQHSFKQIFEIHTIKYQTLYTFCMRNKVLEIKKKQIRKQQGFRINKITKIFQFFI